MFYNFNMCHIFISCISFVFYILGLFLSSDFFVFCFVQIGWEAPHMKHL
jgi:hypothetical protein